MIYKNCQYIVSAVKKSQYPNTNNLPEFVFLGRSNVGKSSFINALTSRKMLAKTSSKPGKTQTMNFFLIDEKFYLIDAPGYGYANKSYGTRMDFGNYIEEYIHDNKNLKVCFLLVDTKVGPTKDDVLMYEYLVYHNLNVAVIATKSDKVGTTLIMKHKKQIKEKLNIENDKIFLTSSLNKKGFEQIVDLIESYCK